VTYPPPYPPPPGGYPPPGAHRPYTPPRRRWPWVLGGVLLLLVLVAVTNPSGTPGRTGTSATSATTSPRAVAPAAAPPAASPAAAPPAAAAPGAIPGNGTYDIPGDYPAGKYKSAGAVPNVVQLCIWQVRNGAGHTIDYGSASDESQEIARVVPGEFETSGCHEWIRQE
jgi:hypothetical protein